MAHARSSSKSLNAGARRSPCGLAAPVCVLLFALLSLALPVSTVARADAARLSRPGEYEGYSAPVYTEWVRSTRYLTVRDGTKLAADIFRPARAGQAVEEPLPVIWTADRYNRATLTRQGALTQLNAEQWLQTMLRYGYVVGVVDVRGSGSSLGTSKAPFSRQEAEDAYDVTEWFAAQSWSNGRVGMFGRSYLGIMQYLAAGEAPPHLKAIFPEMAMFDLYEFAYPGGIFRDDFARKWGETIRGLDEATTSAPVQGEEALLAQAAQAHRSNGDIFRMLEGLPNRDSRGAGGAPLGYEANNPAARLSAIGKSKVAVYHLAGWHDMWPRDALLWFKNLENPQKIIIGPWAHGESQGFGLAAEHLRWYDYWLKGVENGVMNEAPIHYYTFNAPRGREWRSARQWPLPETQPTRYYMRAGPSGSVRSRNDGTLDTRAPEEPEGSDAYAVNYTTTSGASSRWANGYGAPFSYPDMTPNGEKSLSYTTPPLSAPTEVTGHPVANLWVNSTGKDGDFFVYLEDVSQNGFAQYVTEGLLRASHRATSVAPFDNLGLPYHGGAARDLKPLGGEPVELAFDLLPTSYIFPAGHRIRVTIACADRDNARTPVLTPPPTVNVYRDASRPSYITLPVIPQRGTDADASSQPAPAPRAEASGIPLLLVSLGGVGTALAAFAALYLYRRRRTV